MRPAQTPMSDRALIVFEAHTAAAVPSMYKMQTCRRGNAMYEEARSWESMHSPLDAARWPGQASTNGELEIFIHAGWN